MQNKKYQENSKRDRSKYHKKYQKEREKQLKKKSREWYIKNREKFLEKSKNIIMIIKKPAGLGENFGE